MGASPALLLSSLALLGVSTAIWLTRSSVWIDLPGLAVHVLVWCVLWTAFRHPLQSFIRNRQEPTWGFRLSAAALRAGLAAFSLVLSWQLGSLLLHLLHRHL